MFHKADGAVQALTQLLEIKEGSDAAMSVPELEMIMGGKIDPESVKALDGQDKTSAG